MRKTIGTATIMLALIAPFAGQAQEAEVSANAGWVSQYYSRTGIHLDSGSAGYLRRPHLRAPDWMWVPEVSTWGPGRPMWEMALRLTFTVDSEST